METTVIIPTCDNLDKKNGSLSLVLQCLQEASSPSTEVLLIDNSTEPESRSWVKSEARRMDVRFIGCEYRNSVAHARNVGISAARGEILAFIDDDTLIPRGALTKLENLIRPGVFACGAERRYLPMNLRKKVENFKGKNVYDQASELAPSSPSFPLVEFEEALRLSIDSQIGEFSTYISNFGGIYSEDVVRVGLFDQTYVGWGHEDLDLMWRLLESCEFYNLRGELSVIHIDHLVTPNQYQEHCRNFKTHVKCQLNRGKVVIPELLFFSRPLSTSRSRFLVDLSADRAFDFPKIFNNKAQLPTPALHGILEESADASVIIHGSVASELEASDIDVLILHHSKLEIEAEHWREMALDGMTIQIQSMSSQKMLQFVQNPDHIPDTWLWEVGKLINGVWLQDPLLLHKEVCRTLKCTEDRKNRFIISHSIGKFLDLDSKARRGRCSHWRNANYYYRYFSEAWFCVHGRFPTSYYFPYSFDLELLAWLHLLKGPILSPVDGWTAVKILERFADIHRDWLSELFDLSGDEMWLVYPSNLSGFTWLKERFNIELNIPGTIRYGER